MMLRPYRKKIKLYGMIIPYVFIIALLTTVGSKSRNTYVFVLALTGFIGNKYWKDLKLDHEKKHLNGGLPDAPQNINIQAIRTIREKTARRSEFVFVVLGDSQRRHKTFKKILEDASRHNPDFIIHTGDLTTGGRYYQYKESLEAISSFKTPIVFAVGNHDVSHNGERCFAMMFGPQNFFFDVGDYRFIFVNNNSEKASCSIDSLPDPQNGSVSANGIDEYTLETIERVLEEKKNSFVVMHMPPPLGPFRFHSFQMNSDRFLDLMKKNAGRVKSVFCGHIHGFGEQDHHGVPYVVTGGAGGRLRRDCEGIVAKHHYVVVKVSGNTVTRRVHYV